MKFSVSLLAAIATAASGAAITPSDAAAPASSDLMVRAPEGSLSKRASMQVYLYEHINYGGAVAYVDAPIAVNGQSAPGSTCRGLIESWRDRASSIKLANKPSGRNVACQFWRSGNCGSGGSLSIASNTAELGSFNDAIESVACWYY